MCAITSPFNFEKSNCLFNMATNRTVVQCNSAAGVLAALFEYCSHLLASENKRDDISLSYVETRRQHTHTHTHIYTDGQWTQIGGRHQRRSQGFVLRCTSEARRAEIQGRRPRTGEGLLPHQLGDLGERCKLPRRGSGRHFGRTKSPENAFSGCKCRLVPAKTT